MLQPELHGRRITGLRHHREEPGARDDPRRVLAHDGAEAVLVGEQRQELERRRAPRLAHAVHEARGEAALHPRVAARVIRELQGAGLDSIHTAKEGSSRVLTQFLYNILAGDPIQLVDGGNQRRSFTAAEDTPPEGSSVTVLSHAFWQTQYGGRADALGSTLRIGLIRICAVLSLLAGSVYVVWRWGWSIASN